jgi:hypothetical protein
MQEAACARLRRPVYVCTPEWRIPRFSLGRVRFGAIRRGGRGNALGAETLQLSDGVAPALLTRADLLRDR